MPSRSGYNPEFASVNSHPVPQPRPRWNPRLHSRPDRHVAQAGPVGVSEMRCSASVAEREVHGPGRELSCNLGWMGLFRKGEALFFSPLYPPWTQEKVGLGLRSVILPSHAISEGRQQGGERLKLKAGETLILRTLLGDPLASCTSKFSVILANKSHFSSI